jgi:hypothetical protein
MLKHELKKCDKKQTLRRADRRLRPALWGEGKAASAGHFDYPGPAFRDGLSSPASGRLQRRRDCPYSHGPRSCSPLVAISRNIPGPGALLMMGARVACGRVGDFIMALSVEAVEPGTPVFLTQRYGRRGKKTVGTVLRDLGASLEIRTDGGQAYFSRSEVSLLNEALHPLFPMRATLPYGKWSCADGREALFNRDFQPIWERLPGQASRRADRDAIYEYAKEKRFFSDQNPPWTSDRSLRRSLDALLAFGVSEDGKIATKASDMQPGEGREQGEAKGSERGDQNDTANVPVSATGAGPSPILKSLLAAVSGK